MYRQLWVIITCCFIGKPHLSEALPRKSCHVQDGRADCSHLSLSAVPPDLPRNITSLDMSHNRLVGVHNVSLNLYPGILHLNVSYNSIKKLEDLCQTLPLLQTLNLEHNQVHLLMMEDLSHCTQLTYLKLASNRLKLSGEPFSPLQKLKYLDVSLNKLQSAKLGTLPQLPSLVTLNLAFNDFTALKREDFSLLNQSSSLQVLNLSSVSLKILEPGCFKPISFLHTLILDGSNMGTTVISRVCSELSGTAIDTLYLRKMKLVTVTKSTFKGLQKTNLTNLDLSSNGMGKIEPGSFCWLSNLHTLILSDNNIKHLTKGTFEGLERLKRLYLTKALVKSRTSSTPIIDEFAFQPLSELECLMLQRTAIREITVNTFSGLKSLIELDISWSSSTSLSIITNNTFVSLENAPLRKLNLIKSGVKKIDPGSFSVLRNLTILLLDYNYIMQTLSGREFEGLGQIQEIHMSNNIQSIDLSSSSFVNVPSLRILTLGKSLKAEALNLENSPFKPLTNLTILDLSNNNIANLRKNTLDGLVNLKILKLQHNNLARLWKKASLGGPVLFLEQTHSLVTLQMDYNGLDEIPVEALKGLKNLRELSLNNNLLNSLEDSVFSDLTSLQVLRLEKNLITSVRSEVFGIPMSNLTLLVMNRNPFDCTCESILWFVTWLNTTNTTSVPGLKDQYMCNTPRAYFSQPIMEFDPFSCKDMTPFQTLYILSSTAVFLLIVIAFTVHFHSWRIQFYWNVMINRTLGFSDARAEEGREFEYDAYVINSKEDESWVEKRMIPLENERCQFFWEERDADIGMLQLESIVNNMRKSRKILFVITENLLKDQWCRRFKVYQALHQVIEASRDSVILVFLEDVPDYKLYRSLYIRRGMLRSCCVLDWPVQKERVSAFHQKLLIALGMTNRFKE
ncbi:toll-like receptor 3 [Pholidichthys leucotaenia]